MRSKQEKPLLIHDLQSFVTSINIKIELIISKVSYKCSIVIIYISSDIIANIMFSYIHIILT